MEGACAPGPGISPQGHLAISETRLSQPWGANGIWWAEARDAAEHSTVHRPGPCLRESSGLKPTVLMLRNPALRQEG